MDSTGRSTARLGVGLLAIICVACVAIVAAWIIHANRPHGMSGKYFIVDLKSLANFEMDPSNGTMQDVPAECRALDGKFVELEGEMWSPAATGQHVDNFVLVREILRSFGPTMKVQSLIMCTVAPTSAASYYQGRVIVRGTLHVKIVKEDGKIQCLYEMDVDSVAPTPDK